MSLESVCLFNNVPVAEQKLLVDVNGFLVVRAQEVNGRQAELVFVVVVGQAVVVLQQLLLVVLTVGYMHQDPSLQRALWTFDPQFKSQSQSPRFV